MELATINHLLPAEILGRVLGLLSHGDLRSAVLVCRWWREVGEQPLLWRWARIKVDCAASHPRQMPEFRRPITRMEVTCTNALRARSHMRFSKFWDFWTPSPLSMSHSRNLSVLSVGF